MALERELKFSLLDPYVPALPELLAALEGTPFEVAAAPLEEQHDRYFDDDAGGLRAAGWALRRRQLDGRGWATLKAAGSVQGALHEREELELPLAEGDDPPWPGPIRDRIDPLVDVDGLRPRVELRTSRVRFAILRDGAEVATLSFDAVEARAPGGERSALFDEVEIEARGDLPEVELRAIGQAIEDLVRLTPSAVSKLERAEALLLLATW